MCYTLPKIWQGRIQKYWEKFMPKDFPASDSVFSLTFADEDDKNAVEEMEASLGTEESVIIDKLPEGNYLKSYIGTYDVNVDVDEIPEEGIYTLLSPEKVPENEDVTALHYTNGKWEVVEDATVEDGYVYGTLKTFSPIAIFTSMKEIYTSTTSPGYTGTAKHIVCVGNPVKVYTKEDDSIVIVNTNTGYEIPINKGEITRIVGGTIDGSYVPSTSVTVVGVNNFNMVLSPGSSYIDEGSAIVDEINVRVIDSRVRCVSGSYGAVRTGVYNAYLENVSCSYAGCGEAYKQVNTPPTSLASRAFCKKANWTIKNCTIDLLFLSGHCEYYYVDQNEGTIIDGTYGYVINGGSNDGTGTSKVDISDATISIYQSTNRGNVKSAYAKFTNCNVDSLYIDGDASDKTVTGTTEKIKIDICSGGTYNILRGTEGGELITKEQIDTIVDSVKVTRNAVVTIDPAFKSMLGSKYIIK
jgi:archaellum component FlaG (FlaF/FlaG flagellin family)